MNKLILCVDLGSSSVRCSLYELVDDLVVEGNDGRAAVQVVDGLVTGLSWQAVHPHTGRLCLQQDDDRSLFAVVEACIDETLRKLATSTKSDGAIVAVGFSSLVMNLLGVDAEGQPVGEEATLTYACHGSAVAAKVQELQGYETRPFGDPLLWEAPLVNTHTLTRSLSIFCIAHVHPNLAVSSVPMACVICTKRPGPPCTRPMPYPSFAPITISILIAPLSNGKA
jgi:hypothetical protein